MGKLFNWIIGIAAVATTAYVLNTYSISRTNNGINFKGPKSDTTITYNSGIGDIRNTYNTGKDNIETRLGKDSNGFFGSIKDKGYSYSGRFSPQKNNGLFSVDRGSLLSDWFFDYDGAKTNEFNKWFSGFDMMTPNHMWNYRRI